MHMTSLNRMQHRPHRHSVTIAPENCQPGKLQVLMGNHSLWILDLINFTGYVLYFVTFRTSYSLQSDGDYFSDLHRARIRLYITILLEIYR